MLTKIVTAFPASMSAEHPAVLRNFVGGKWVEPKSYMEVEDPLNGEPFIQMPDTRGKEFDPFLEGLRSCPKSGLHNPIANPQRAVMLGQVCFEAAMALEDELVAEYFTRLIMRVMPKSYAQAEAEVTVTRQFLKNFSGDGVRFLLRGFSNLGDHPGQESREYPWPFGPVVIIAPFNFPLEIPVLQFMGALFMGNRPTIKVASTVSIVMEQFLRLLHWCGLPAEDADLVHCSGAAMAELMDRASEIIRMTQFTGSSEVAEELAELTRGRIKIEDAGFDWKILGPDYAEDHLESVAYQCDQDAYAASGQKCSAQSILFAHENWVEAGLYESMARFAAQRKLEDLTIGPVLTWSTREMLDHVTSLLEIPGAKVRFGAETLEGHSIPSQYGAIRPTAVEVPIKALLDPQQFKLITTEIFGPLQVLVTWKYGELPILLDACEHMDQHLTAAVVSGDPAFVNRVLGATINGTTYVGYRARTTGAPQNHLFGPAGDPRAAGIGTPEAIIRTWSVPRAVIWDNGEPHSELLTT